MPQVRGGKDPIYCISECPGGSVTWPELRVPHFGFISEGEVHTEEMADRQTDSLDYGLIYTNISTPLLSDQILTCCYVRSAIIIASAVTLSKEISSPLFDFWMPYRWDAAFEEWL